MCIREVSVPKGNGLHSKSASSFINMANKYKSWIWIGRGKSSVDAKNLFKVLSLNVSGGILVEICANGVDEKQAVDDLVEFIENLS